MKQQQVRKTRTVPKMSETQRAQEEDEFNERIARARRASAKARRVCQAATRLIATVDGMTA